MLSFNAEEEEIRIKPKFKSIHDALPDSHLSKEVVEIKSEATDRKPKQKRKVESDDEDNYDKKMKSQVLAKQAANAGPTKAESMQEQIKRLQSEIKQIGAPKKEAEKKVKKEKSSVAKMREEFLASGKAVPTYRKDTKGDVETRLRGFRKTLKESAKTSKPVAKKSKITADEDWECSLHYIKNCSSCRDTFGESISDDDDGWMNATLNFEKQIGANVYEPKIDDYTVVDPRQGYPLLTSAKADPFGRDIQVLGDIKGRQKVIWTEKSTRTVKSLTDQYLEQPEFLRQ